MRGKKNPYLAVQQHLKRLDSSWLTIISRKNKNLHDLMWKEKSEDNPNTKKEKETHSLSLRLNSANTCVSSKFRKKKLDHISHKYLCPLY